MANNHEQIIGISVNKKIEWLKEKERFHIDFSEKLFFPVIKLISKSSNMLVFSAINRSKNLVLPFCELIEKKNLIASVPLIRLQLDNLLRLYAGFIVSDREIFVDRVMRGEQISKIKDRTGKIMRDNYLCDKLSLELKDDCLTDLYKHLSGFIHFSDKHFMNAIKIHSEKSLWIELGDITFENDIYEFYVENYIGITKLFLYYCHLWYHPDDEDIDVFQKYQS